MSISNIVDNLSGCPVSVRRQNADVTQTSSTRRREERIPSRSGKEVEGRARFVFKCLSTLEVESTR
jgi:hypothetical protein